MNALLVSKTRGLHAVHVAVFVYICDRPLKYVLLTNSDEGQQTVTDTLLGTNGRGWGEFLEYPAIPPSGNGCGSKSMAYKCTYVLDEAVSSFFSAVV